MIPTPDAITTAITVKAMNAGIITKAVMSAGTTTAKASTAVITERKQEICNALEPMKKTIYILSTLALMLIVSRFIVRIVDATVQIDSDIGMLLLLLLLVNAVIVYIGCRLYRASTKK